MFLIKAYGANQCYTQVCIFLPNASKSWEVPQGVPLDEGLKFLGCHLNVEG